MPYLDPERKRANDLRYKSERREKLCAQEKERVKRIKEKDPEAWLRISRERSARHREKYKDDPAYKDRCKVYARKSWEKRKDDPVVKAKNIARVTNYLKTSVQYRLSHAIRTRLNSAIRNKEHGKRAVKELGCTLVELIVHLEKQFKPKMSWDNWSPRGWHIDHIKPLSSFDLQDPLQYAAACHYTNLQPLWSFDNISKGGRYKKEFK